MARGTWTVRSAVMFGAVLVAAVSAGGIEPQGPARAPVAVIVNAQNGAPDPSLDDLRAIFSLDRQFWPDGRRIVLILPRSSSVSKQVLLDRVYNMSDADLRKFWVGKLFRGAIPSIPMTLTNAPAAASAVLASDGAISAVLASEVPPGVRVLKVDGRTPEDPAYPLAAEAEAHR